MYSHVHGQWIWNKSITAVQRDEGLFLEKEMATHSSVPVWIIPRTEKPGELQAMELQSRTWWLSTRAHTEGSFTSKRYGDNWIPVHEENEPGGHDTKRWGRKFKASLPQLVTGKNDQNQPFQSSGTWLDSTARSVLDERRVLALCRRTTRTDQQQLRPPQARRSPAVTGAPPVWLAVETLSSESLSCVLCSAGKPPRSQIWALSGFGGFPCNYWKFNRIGLSRFFFFPFGAKYLRKFLSGHCLTTDNGTEIPMTTHKKE